MVINCFWKGWQAIWGRRAVSLAGCGWSWWNGIRKDWDGAQREAFFGGTRLAIACWDGRAKGYVRNTYAFRCATAYAYTYVPITNT